MPDSCTKGSRRSRSSNFGKALFSYYTLLHIQIKCDIEYLIKNCYVYTFYTYFKLECKGYLINIVYEKNFLLRIHFSAVYICLSKVFESCNSSRRYPLEFLKAWVYICYIIGHTDVEL